MTSKPNFFLDRSEENTFRLTFSAFDKDFEKNELLLTKRINKTSENLSKIKRWESKYTKFFFNRRAMSIKLAREKRPSTEVSFDIQSSIQKISFRFEGSPSIYGFGGANGLFSKKDGTFSILNDDTLLYSKAGSSYSSFPIFWVRNAGFFRAWYIHSPYPMLVSISRNQRGERKVSVEINSEGLAKWPLDIVYFEGTPESISTSIQNFCGKAAMPPAWSLGFHQCRWSYRSQKKVLKIALRMRREKIPCDSIWLDIHYMNGYRVFTWNTKKFPDPKKLSDELKSMGMKMVAIVDPGVKKEAGYFVYEEGFEKDYFLKNENGKNYVGNVWPGKVVYPDFSQKEVREWWSSLSRELLNAGVWAFWNDMNDPVLMMGKSINPLEEKIVHKSGTHLFHRNDYANNMAKAAFDSQKGIRPKERPFVLSRSGRPGIQRYAALWTGDNHSTWAHLRENLAMVLNLGLSGIPFSGADIGGFASGPGMLGVIKLRRNKELMARWLALGSLMPFCRMHTALYSVSQEPWSFGEDVLQVARRFLSLRYMLMPYIYREMINAHRTGAPFIRPVWWFDPDYPQDFEHRVFFLGHDIFLAPIIEKGVTRHEVFLPAGTWIHFKTGKKYNGNQRLVETGDWLSLPMFVREGSVLPFANPRENVSDTLNAGLYMALFGSGEIHSKIQGEYYYDDGITDASPNKIGFSMKIAGKREKNKTSLKFNLSGVSNAPLFSNFSFLLPQEEYTFIKNKQNQEIKTQDNFVLPQWGCEILWQRLEVSWNIKKLSFQNS